MGEEYIRIDFWCRPLKRHQYHESEIYLKEFASSESMKNRHASTNESKMNTSNISADNSPVAADSPFSNTSDNSIEERYPYEEDDIHAYDLGSQILINQIPEEVRQDVMHREQHLEADWEDESEDEDKDIGDAEKVSKKANKVSLKERIDRMLYDYSEVELEEQEERATELINQDHFYDEVLPLDDGIDYENTNQFNKKGMVVLLGLLILSGIFVVFSFRY